MSPAQINDHELDQLRQRLDELLQTLRKATGADWEPAKAEYLLWLREFTDRVTHNRVLI